MEIKDITFNSEEIGDSKSLPYSGYTYKNTTTYGRNNSPYTGSSWGGHYPSGGKNKHKRGMNAPSNVNHMLWTLNGSECLVPLVEKIMSFRHLKDGDKSAKEIGEQNVATLTGIYSNALDSTTTQGRFVSHEKAAVILAQIDAFCEELDASRFKKKLYNTMWRVP